MSKNPSEHPSKVTVPPTTEEVVADAPPEPEDENRSVPEVIGEEPKPQDDPPAIVVPGASEVPESQEVDEIAESVPEVIGDIPEEPSPSDSKPAENDPKSAAEDTKIAEPSQDDPTVEPIPSEPEEPASTTVEALPEIAPEQTTPAAESQLEQSGQADAPADQTSSNASIKSGSKAASKPGSNASIKSGPKVSSKGSVKSTSSTASTTKTGEALDSASKQPLADTEEPPPLPDSQPPEKGDEITDAEQTLALAPDAIPGEEISEDATVPETAAVPAGESDASNPDDQTSSDLPSESGPESTASKPINEIPQGSSLFNSKFKIEDDLGFQPHDQDTPWILEKLYRTSMGRSGSKTSGSKSSTTSSKDDDTDGPFEGEGWILERMYRIPTGVPVPPELESKPLKSKPTTTTPSKVQTSASKSKVEEDHVSNITLDTEEGILIGDKDSGWILEKMHLTARPVKKNKNLTGSDQERERFGGGCNPDEDINLEEIDPDRIGRWVLEKLRAPPRPGLCDVPEIKHSKTTAEKPSNVELEGDETGVPVGANMNEASTLYEKDGQWQLEKMILRAPKKSKKTLAQMGFAGVVSTQAIDINCNSNQMDDENCCEDRKLKPFCDMVRTALSIYDTLTSCDGLTCNECDPPGTEPDEGIFAWAEGVITGLLAPNTIIVCDENDVCEVVPEPDPCSGAE